MVIRWMQYQAQASVPRSRGAKKTITVAFKQEYRVVVCWLDRVFLLAKEETYRQLGASFCLFNCLLTVCATAFGTVFLAAYSTDCRVIVMVN